PGEKRGEVHISLRGDLMGILGFSDPRGKQMETCCMTAGEAGPRNQIIYISAKNAPVLNLRSNKRVQRNPLSLFAR
ncbi:hypothetical protein, partial [Acetobacter thailandicus]|uniref:hypothetical protein n=1 Tax=Acetobacter thailandicus TaxID=1502842 RepID=UPI001BA58A9C